MEKSTLKGTFLQVLHSPKGGIEGMLLETDGQVLQFVLAKGDEAGAAIVAGIKAGQLVSVTAGAVLPSPRGEPAHSVHALDRIVSVDGKAPKKTTMAAGYTGRIVRINYARHGVPNGFVLDTGDFIHVKPEGFAKLGLKLGDSVSADGDAHFLSTGNGWAVEARTVNRKTIK